MIDLETMIAYESGELNEEQTIEFFQSLLDSGLIYHLQGSYQRVARDLLKAGLIHYEPKCLRGIMESIHEKP